ncbi:hypothetical protein GCE86_05790 [Micromonospora terminaliae]|uniref:Cupin domain-containing protein n=1 Tax=Micromonospora terminaliae TaxID=1914461 RepID=A0AAJ2ZKB8_9ACTN|nr:hypothetical protein [Micromonospora terminaliae]NES31236.1 hypothetical protein [Micromonospora terminaliae]QGL46604.1 hypothetical protein GCE86_05790 [Micromonospora terminaliae]
MARVWYGGQQSRAHHRATGEVIVTEVADLPIGVSVSVWTFAPGSQVTLGPSYDDQSFTVLSGSGWVDSEENGRQDLKPGAAAYVPIEDTPTFGSADGMTVVKVFGGMMMPR